MPATVDVSTIDSAIALMREGKVNEADALLSAAQASAIEFADRAAGKPAPPKPPRAASVVMLDLFDAIVAHQGRPPRVEALLNELKESTNRAS